MKRKLIALLLIVASIATLTACGSKSNDPLPDPNGSKGQKTVTLKEFLDSGPKVAFESRLYEVAKDRTPSYMYLFEDGKVYVVCHETNSNGFPDRSAKLTYGEIAKMSDTELLEYARKHKQTEYGGYTRITSGYTLHVYTDSTGNNREYEEIYVSREKLGDDGWSETYDLFYTLEFTATRQAVVYDSTFTGIVEDPYDPDICEGLFFRTDSNLTIILDNVGDKGVEID